MLRITNKNDGDEGEYWREPMLSFRDDTTECACGWVAGAQHDYI